jgi:hypothetical protein
MKSFAKLPHANADNNVKGFHEWRVSGSPSRLTGRLLSTSPSRENMSILNRFVRNVTNPSKAVETAKVLDSRGQTVLLETSRGRLWARSEIPVTVGAYVTFARRNEGYQVIAAARKPRQNTKSA